ncbi:STAS domain-containing protein [Pseudonocardia broussonetiae]|uniref:Anti-anti-sigma factor n=1 Tax=Pseudonocardia broussonetiae TaxID=2736640 RepID=A0A6M6JP68_9PSEU|nr:STAS domain-containing protein [Pseudonocardia broussonetiae]QJY48239.1 anti-anti-sigma factor [Pseudonocardia broussonetiae]
MVQEEGRSPAGGGREPGAEGSAATRVPAREQLMTVTVDERDEAVVLTVTGEVDGLTAPRLQDAICGVFDRLDGRVLVVDLTSVGFFGSPGLHTLTVSAREAVEQRGHRPLRIVVDDTRPVVRPIRHSGLDALLALYHDVPTALRDR